MGDQNDSSVFQALKKFRSGEDLVRALALIGLRPDDDYSENDLKIAFDKLNDIILTFKNPSANDQIYLSICTNLCIGLLQLPISLSH